MYDNIMDDMIQKYEEIVLRFNDIKKQQEQLEKDINNFYSYLFSLQRLNTLNHEKKG
jgi:hypothetical protein